MTPERPGCRPSPDPETAPGCGRPPRTALWMEATPRRAVTSTGFGTDSPDLGPLQPEREPLTLGEQLQGVAASGARHRPGSGTGLARGQALRVWVPGSQGPTAPGTSPPCPHADPRAAHRIPTSALREVTAKHRFWGTGAWRCHWAAGGKAPLGGGAGVPGPGCRCLKAPFLPALHKPQPRGQLLISRWPCRGPGSPSGTSTLATLPPPDHLSLPPVGTGLTLVPRTPLQACGPSAPPTCRGCPSTHH